MSSDKRPYVEFRKVTKSYEGYPALKNISLKIPYNSYFCICGPTGSGKSTLLKLLAGLVKPDEGEIYIDGKLVNDIEPEDRGIGMLFEHMTYALFPHLSIYENIIYGPRVKGEPPKETKRTAAEMLQLVLLSDRADDLPEVMSGGMKQRVALARALMTGSNLILLDEPLGALDAKIRLNLRKELVHMVKSLGDLTVIHVTQDIEEALMVSDYMVVLFFGDILQSGTPEELYDHPNSIEVCNFLSKANFFEGKVVNLKEKHALIELQDTTITVSDTSHSKGTQVVVAIRATDLTIQKKEKTTTNQFKGKILRRQFIHGTMRYETELPNKKMIVVIEPHDPEFTFEEEQEVSVSFEPEMPLVFPHPGEPLEKILGE
ncbi:MAG: ABC transporter ATP-binding protein [Candidatus Helarchaeota archaeon]|nr:ABC transporter ATP-binding protein [Candidatus Helarchaeota archaeon]